MLLSSRTAPRGAPSAPLARTESHGHGRLQGRLGNVIFSVGSPGTQKSGTRVLQNGLFPLGRMAMTRSPGHTCDKLKCVRMRPDVCWGPRRLLAVSRSSRGKAMGRNGLKVVCVLVSASLEATAAATSRE